MAPFQAFCRLLEPFMCWPKFPMMFRLSKKMSTLLARQKSLDLLRMETLENFGFIWACNSDSSTKTLDSLKWAMKALVLCTCVAKCCRTQYVAFLTLRRAMSVSQRLQWAKTISFFSYDRWLDLVWAICVFTIPSTVFRNFCNPLSWSGKLARLASDFFDSTFLLEASFLLLQSLGDELWI